MSERYRFEQSNIGRATQFLIADTVDAEKLAGDIFASTGGDYDLSRSIKGRVYAFHGRVEYITIDGTEWISNFRILSGVSHNLYDSFDKQYREVIKQIRSVLGS
jgi:hypothetical protein